MTSGWFAVHNLAFVLFFFNPPSRGGLAQLVERLLCKQNVNGSNPLTSTIFQESVSYLEGKSREAKRFPEN